MFKRKKLWLTDEDYEKVINEMAERLKDLIYTDAYKKVKAHMSKERVQEMIESNDNYELSYTFTTCNGDYKQIYNSIKRRRDNLERRTR